ncbi:hypothetical protein FP026_28390 [Rhizobium tropici]|uniref:Uncharacterized protein n=1 Tax=Rhizobium tropici TaxID=398 RepID=A0A5B0VL70_RHITR|nr:hypothetical protein [Rhizobium tropici]KAA1175412.1 hypothetical protein FP026_28390 [Rhizobium tropici]
MNSDKHSIEHQPEQHLIRLLEQKDDQIRDLEDAVWDADSRERTLRQQLDQIHNSFSWQLTRPVRAGSRKLSAIKRLPSRSVMFFLAGLLRWLSARPHLKDACLRLAQRFPMLKRRLAAIAIAQGYGVPTLDFSDDNQEGQWFIDAPKSAVARWSSLLQDISKSK